MEFSRCTHPAQSDDASAAWTSTRESVTTQRKPISDEPISSSTCFVADESIVTPRRLRKSSASTATAFSAGSSRAVRIAHASVRAI
jgi:hypothetical protein